MAVELSQRPNKTNSGCDSFEDLRKLFQINGTNGPLELRVSISWNLKLPAGNQIAITWNCPSRRYFPASSFLPWQTFFSSHRILIRPSSNSRTKEDRIRNDWKIEKQSVKKFPRFETTKTSPVCLSVRSKQSSLLLFCLPRRLIKPLLLCTRVLRMRLYDN